MMNGKYVYSEDAPMICNGYGGSDEFSSREFDIIRKLTQSKKYGEIAVDLAITLCLCGLHHLKTNNGI